MSHTLALNNYTVYAGQTRLIHNISLQIKTGEILALIGSSGSGKSLTCCAALGALPHGLHQSSGSVLFDDHQITHEQLRGHTISTIMQNPRSAFNPVHTMKQHALETLTISKQIKTDSYSDVIVKTMREAGLDQPEKILSLYPHEMSGGMLQRMMIALTMLSGSPFLFADEPTTDLDLVMQSKILELLKSLVDKQQLGILLVTHDMGVVAKLAHRVAVIDQGQIVEHNSISTIFTRPDHPITRELVNAHLSLYNMALE